MPGNNEGFGAGARVQGAADLQADFWSGVFLLSVTFFSAAYFLHPALSLTRLLAGLMVFILLIRPPAQLYLLDRKFAALLFSFLIFTAYLTLVEAIRGEEPVKIFLAQTYCIVFLLFFSLVRPFRLAGVFQVIVFLMAVMGLLQVSGINLQISQVVPELPGLGFYHDLYEREHGLNYLENMGRANGPFELGIGYSLVLGICAIVLHDRFRVTGDWLSLFNLVLVLIAIYFTYTRSAIFGVAIILFAYEALHGRHRLFRLLLIVCLAIAAVTYGYERVRDSDDDLSARLAVLSDGETNTKLTTNVAVAVYTIRHHPLFGFSRFEFEEHVDEALKETGAVLYYDLSYYYTNHNQLVYYLKHYGLVGLLLFVVFHLRLLIYIGSMKPQRRVVPLLAFLYCLQFSLLHNNFTVETPLLMAVIGIAGLRAAAPVERPVLATSRPVGLGRNSLGT